MVMSSGMNLHYYEVYLFFKSKSITTLIEISWKFLGNKLTEQARN
jgi:hypothetical protein